jgi:hypothetical protein
MSVPVEGENDTGVADDLDCNLPSFLDPPSLCPFLETKHLGHLLEYTEHNESP